MSIDLARVLRMMDAHYNSTAPDTIFTSPRKYLILKYGRHAFRSRKNPKRTTWGKRM